MNYIPRKLIRPQNQANRQKKQVRTIKRKVLSSLTLASTMLPILVNIASVQADENLQSSVVTSVTDASQIKTGNEFIDTIAPSATYLAQNYDLYASVMIAQAVLESGSGTSGLASAPYYNLFGIKGSYQGNFVTMSTQEQASDGTYTTIDASFRSYPSYAESLEDYAQLLATDFYQGARKSVAQNYAEATNFLTGRYATSLSYAQSLNSIIELYDLTRFDNADGSSAGVLSLANESNIATQTSSKIYTVVEGDTLNSIAMTYSTTVENLISTNGLVSDIIEIGQKIVINQVKRALVTDEERQAAEEQLYTIQSGDTLSEIAYAHGISLEDLMSWNGLTESLIYPDNQLIVKQADPEAQNKLKIRESQLSLESDYTGELFNLPQFDNFSYNIKGDLEQYQVDYFSNDVWQATLQKRTYSDIETATIVNGLFDIDGKEQTLEDGSIVKITTGTTLSNLRYSENQLSINIINQVDDDSIDYFKDDVKAKSLELMDKINQSVHSEVVLRINLTKDDVTRYAVSWREGNVVYTFLEQDLDRLIANL